MKTVGWKRSKMRSRAGIERIFLWISLLFVDCINILEENIVNEYIYIYYKFNTHKTLLQHNLICLRNFCYWIDIYIYYFRSIHLEIAFNSERSFFHHPSPYIYIYIYWSQGNDSTFIIQSLKALVYPQRFWRASGRLNSSRGGRVVSRRKNEITIL